MWTSKIVTKDQNTQALVAFLSNPGQISSTPTDKVFTLCTVTYAVSAGAKAGDELGIGCTISTMSTTNGDFFRPLGNDLPAEATIADRFNITASAGRIVVGVKQLMAAVPFAAQYRMVNMAKISGTKTSQALDVLGLYSDGTTLGLPVSSCSSSDPSVLQLDALCRTVFVDGSEVGSAERVSVNITVNGFGSTLLPFVVYAPALPVKMLINDDTLQRVMGWKDPAASCQTQFQFTYVEADVTFSFGTIRIPSSDPILKTQLVSTSPDVLKLVSDSTCVVFRIIHFI